MEYEDQGSWGVSCYNSRDKEKLLMKERKCIHVFSEPKIAYKTKEEIIYIVLSSLRKTDQNKCVQVKNRK